MARKSRVNLPEMKVMPEEKTFLVGAYTRLSVEDGDDEEQNSIGNQKKIALNYIADRINLRLVETYSDYGYTGMNFNRPDFQRMMEDLRTGRINCVLVKDISRLGRHFSQTAQLVEKVFPAIGTRLISINDDYDSAALHADAMALTLPLKMVMNDYYVKDISRKIRSSISAKMDTGEYLPAAGSIPYGYLRDPENMTYKVDEEAATIIQRIYEMRASRMSYSGIVRELNDEDIPCPGRLRYMRGVTKASRYAEALWIRKTVQKILSDQVYIGKRIHGRIKRDKVGLAKTRRSEQDWQIIEHAHPAIITQDLFEQVQQVNAEDRAYRQGFEERPGFNQDYRDLFRGKVFCADCGAVMSGAKGCARKNAKTPSRIFFECGTYRRSTHKNCSCHYVRQETLYQKVKHQLDMQVRLVVDMNRLIEDIKKRQDVINHQNHAETQYSSIVTKRKNIEARLERLLIDVTERVIDKNEYDYMKEKYSEQLETLRKEEAHAAGEVGMMDNAINAARKWASLLKKYQELPELNHTLLDSLVYRIEVKQDRSIRIILNYENPFAMIYSFLERIEVEKDAV